MRKIKFNAKIGVLTWILLPAIFFIINSCGNSSANKNDNELAKEVQDVKDELGESIIEEKKALKSEIDSIVNVFDNKVSTIERKVNEGSKKLNSETQTLLDNLKAERDSLNLRLDVIEQQTVETWEEFKEEVEHDSKAFGNSIENFFKDNT